MKRAFGAILVRLFLGSGNAGFGSKGMPRNVSSFCSAFAIHRRFVFFFWFVVYKSAYQACAVHGDTGPTSPPVLKWGPCAQ